MLVTSCGKGRYLFLPVKKFLVRKNKDDLSSCSPISAVELN
jgi:hypothetical protein